MSNRHLVINVVWSKLGVLNPTFPTLSSPVEEDMENEL